MSRSTEQLSEQGARVGRIVPPNSTLVACIAGSLSSIGRAAITTRPVAFNQQINAVTPNEGVNPYFLFNAISYSQRKIQEVATRGMKKIINKTDFENIELIAPPPEDQNRFAEYWINCRELVTQQIETQERFDDLFDSLLARAFTGELTAAWRESHRNELAQAAAQRDALLGVLAATPGAESPVEAVQLSLPAAQPRRAIHARLDAGLQKLLAAISDLPAYFRPQELVASGGLTPVQTEAGLGVLAALGFVRQVQIDGRRLWRLVDALGESSELPQELAA